tara:strand:+ start:373 stop:561 length:189 start_codon:yes stop_codon:yes gene_type:complete
MYKISNNIDLCIGCGNCANVCKNWKMKDGKGTPVKTEVADLGCNKDAKDQCPAACIKIEEVK